MASSSPSDENKKKESGRTTKDLMVLILSTLQEIFYPLNIVWWKALIFFIGGITGGIGIGFLVGALIKVYLLPAPAPAPAPTPEPVTTTTVTFAPPPW